MAVAIDYVPTWGNRNSSHTWNALIIDEETYAFEPFWDDDRWKYKEIYNNKSVDLLWGKFRLPKVYRHTYEYHMEGPIQDNTLKSEDIPPFFLNPFKKDVSSQYFETKILLSILNKYRRILNILIYVYLITKSGFLFNGENRKRSYSSF